jgi:hypothetical protein
MKQFADVTAIKSNALVGDVKIKTQIKTFTTPLALSKWIDQTLGLERTPHLDTW